MNGYEVVLTEDISSGRVHTRVRYPNGRLAFVPECNVEISTAGEYREITDAQAAEKPAEAFCLHCCEPRSEAS